jgi:Ser/Thr protein kinase RdoA (MazF antagonist)
MHAEGIITDDIHVARQAIPHFELAPDSALRLLNLSENATYLVDDAATGITSVLRVHRRNYHRPLEIESELDWLAALRRDDAGVAVPTVLPARDGRRMVTVEVDGTARHIVHFALVPGAEPDEDTVTADDFGALGQITASLHDHARTWSRPAGFDRFTWDWNSSLGVGARWGRWQQAAGVGPAERALLDRAQDVLHHRLDEYGAGPDRFGLIHADLRLANLIVDGSETTVIDFDDCGFSWYFYDFGAAVSFIEDDPALPQWQDAWVAGYRSRRPMAAADEEMLSSFVMLRRLKLLAWMSTHTHSKESRTKAVTYAQGSCALADRYLASNGLRLS